MMHQLRLPMNRLLRTVAAAIAMMLLTIGSAYAQIPDTVLADLDQRSVDFGPITVGQIAARTFTIRNRTDRTIAGIVGTPTGEGFAVISGGGAFSMAPDGSRTVSVTFAPTEKRLYQDSILIVLSDSAGIRQELTVGLTGYGITISGIALEAVRGGELKLMQIYPNPSRGDVQIDFAIATNARVELCVFSIEGVKFATLVNTQLGAGSHSVVWTPGDAPSGSYIYRLRAGGDVAAGQLIYKR